VSDAASDRMSDRLEVGLGRLLSLGTQLTTVLLSVGLVTFLAAPDARLGVRLIHLGLIVLMLTPVARVVASVITYVRTGQWLFVAATGIVLALLIASFIAAFAG
jgi:Protein of unknown function (DUF1634)